MCAMEAPRKTPLEPKRQDARLIQINWEFPAWRGYLDFLSIEAPPYFPSFQISAESFHRPSVLSHRTRYFPEISFGAASFVVKVKVPISRAAFGPNRLTSTTVSFGLPACSARPFHILAMAALPFTIGAPGGNAIASAAYRFAIPSKSPLLNSSTHLAFAASILAFWANAGAADVASSAMTRANLCIDRLHDFNFPKVSHFCYACAG